MEPGKRFGNYEIVGTLGAGGMGQVYRARDTKLKREVAIKILPATFTEDPIHLQRFQREAQLLATLSHQNIAHVYDIDRVDGVHYMVQELVPGTTLLDELSRGPIEIERTVAIARQIVAGLEAAHQRDIVHRDLKPSNVMVTPDGIVKVLDFGLAKPVVPSEEEGPVGEDTPTIHSTPRADVILGTGAYMPPEQARGMEVDSRADIWAFGCVLYYCLTGTKPFDGETLLDTLAAVVRGAPDWEALPPHTPRKLRDLLRRCLTKKVDNRLQHAGDARIVLDEIVQEIDEGIDDAAPSAVAAPTASTPTWMLPVAMLVGATVGAALWAWLGPGGAGPEPIRSEVNLDEAASFVLQPAASFVVTETDELIYAARTGDRQQLYRRTLDSFEEIPIPGTEGASNPFLSPDGDWIAFFHSDGKLKKVPAMGGRAIPICDVGTGNTGGTWLEDGRIIFAAAFTELGLLEVSSDGGEPREITVPADRGDSFHEWPQRLPSRNAILFSAYARQNNRLAALDLESGEITTILESSGDARYLPSGHLLYAEGGSLFVIGFDVETLTVSGNPRLAVEEVRRGPGQRVRAFFEVSHRGTLAYMPGDVDEVGGRLVWVDRDGLESDVGFEPGEFGHPQISPDGSHVAFDLTTEDGTHATVLELERGTRRRLTSEGTSIMPVWSPDGQHIAFSWTRNGPSSIYRRRSDGTDEPELILTGDQALWPRSWAPTGLAYYKLIVGESSRDIWLLDPMAEVVEPREIVASVFNERSPDLSPNGQLLAFVSDESGRDEVYVRPLLNEAAAAIPISPGGGREPVWSSDGAELFYRSGTQLLAVRIERDPTRPGTPVPLFEDRYDFDLQAHNQYYDVAPDGQRFLMIAPSPSLESVDHLHVVRNWNVELERLLDGR